MDVKYINPFLIAIQNVFDTMIDVPFTLGKPTLKEDNIPTYEISGIIGLSGGVSGCVVISLSEKIALQLTSALLDEEITEVGDDCTDAIGEIANMVAGNAKNDFPVAEMQASKIISLPVHHFLSNKQILYVIEKIFSFYTKKHI